MAIDDPLFDWIEATLTPVWRRDGAHLYEGMASQSNGSLPLVYEPLDLASRSHWRDRGSILDYRTVCGDGRLLDVGPGDGWPSLPIAPLVESVVGVDASETLCRIARANAKRLGTSNVLFLHVENVARLPFDDASFDGITAASCLEQTEDPRAVLAELGRVLRPGGRLRLYYQVLGRRGHEAWLLPLADETSAIFLSAPDLEGERGRHLRVDLALPASDVGERLGCASGPIPRGDLTVEAFERLAPYVSGARGSELLHPSGATWLRWLEAAGFSGARPTDAGADAAAALFDTTPTDARPLDLDALDDRLRPVVAEAVGRPAAIETNPLITAVR